MNSRGMQLAISVAIVFVIGIIVLIGASYFLTDGFRQYKKTTDPFYDQQEVSTAKEVCETACQLKQPLIYCCKDFEIPNPEGGRDLYLGCDDERLAVECFYDCSDFKCAGDE